MCGGYGVMNLVPWGGPTMRAASVANIEVGDLYSFMIPGVVCLALFAFVIVFIVSRIEKKNGAGSETMIAAEEAAEQTEKKQVKKGIYFFNIDVYKRQVHDGEIQLAGEHQFV